MENLNHWTLSGTIRKNSIMQQLFRSRKINWQIIIQIFDRFFTQKNFRTFISSVSSCILLFFLHCLDSTRGLKKHYEISILYSKKELSFTLTACFNILSRSLLLRSSTIIPVERRNMKMKLGQPLNSRIQTERSKVFQSLLTKYTEYIQLQAKRESNVNTVEEKPYKHRCMSHSLVTQQNLLQN